MKMRNQGSIRNKLIFLLMLILGFIATVPSQLLIAQDDGSVYLKSGIKKYHEEWDVTGAIVDLQRALSLGLQSDRDRIKAYECLAFCYSENGERDKAVEAFKRLLEINHNYQLDPGTSPRITEPFDGAKEVGGRTYEDLEPPFLIDLTGTQAVAGRSFTIRVRVKDNVEVARVGIVHRVGSNKEYEKQRDMIEVKKNVYEFVVPEVKKPGITYGIAAWDRDGNRGLLKKGKQQYVKVVDLRPVKSKNWIYYTAGAAVVVGAGIYYLLIKKPEKGTFIIDMPTSY